MACVGSLAPAAPPVVAPTATDYDSPCAIAASPDGSTLYVACSTTRQIAVVDTASTRVMQRVDLPAPPTGCAVTRDAARLYVACAAPRSHVLVIDLDCGAVLDGIMVGHTAMAPVLSADERRLYVCNRFENSVSVLDLTTGTEIERVPVSREPVAAALTSDGRHLLVANHLHNAVTDGPGVAAVVSVIDTTSLRLVRQIQLARGSGLLRGIAVSPDGRYAAVTHLLARYYLPTTEVDFGRINSNALSLIDLERMEYLRNVFLDQARHGAGNPWAVAWTADSSRMVVTLAGTHELCLIDAPLRPQQPVAAGKRIPLRGNGPRSLAVVGHHAYIANYFSDDLAVVDLDAADVEPSRIELSPPSEMSRVRQGEMWFNDATLCYQQWQSCASCHDSDGRMDAMNWDLLNDGIGNPKNAKSLLWAHRTPPAMALGVRTSAEIAVRAGIRHILFAEQPEEVASAIDEYLKSLEPIPSPHLGPPTLQPPRGRLRRLPFAAPVHRPRRSRRGHTRPLRPPGRPRPL
jgi:YVTN family beta-propeller protein